jgi:hypothetical protein
VNQFCVTTDGVRLAYASTGSGYPLVKSANWLNHLDYEWDSQVNESDGVGGGFKRIVGEKSR